MKRYLFIGGHEAKMYYETDGSVHIVRHGEAYNLRTVTIGEVHIPVYALTMLCNEEVIDLLFRAYNRSQ